eukprot:Skav213556  [mRNA]  locus=scaffold263:99442:101484:- [translate_table: standard]
MSMGISKQPASLLDHSAAAPHQVESTPQSTPKALCSMMIPVSTTFRKYQVAKLPVNMANHCSTKSDSTKRILLLLHLVHQSAFNG